jgi:hypothetical protein
VLAFATHQNRILVTSDLRTMPRHLDRRPASAPVRYASRTRRLQDVASRLSLVINWPSSGYRLDGGLPYSCEAKNCHYCSEEWRQPWCGGIAAWARPPQDRGENRFERH